MHCCFVFVTVAVVFFVTKIQKSENSNHFSHHSKRVICIWATYCKLRLWYACKIIRIWLQIFEWWKTYRRESKRFAFRLVCACVCVCVPQFAHIFFRSRMTKMEPWESTYQAQSTAKEPKIYEEIVTSVNIQNSREYYGIHELSIDHKSSQQFPSFTEKNFPSQIICNLFNLSWLDFFFRFQKWQKMMKQ